ncbi:MAG: hypothetical protein QXE05_03470, partial [Nitrososphaeria archaeon]
CKERITRSSSSGEDVRKKIEEEEIIAIKRNEIIIEKIRSYPTNRFITKIMITNVREKVIVFAILLKTLDKAPNRKIANNNRVNSKMVLLKRERMNSEKEIINFTLGSRECIILSCRL